MDQDRQSATVAVATLHEPVAAADRTGDHLSLVLHVAARALAGRCRPRLERLGLTFPQYLVMLVLWDRGPTTVGELGAFLQLDSGTLSPLLKRMEASGLVDRRRRPDDERRVEVSATAAGEALRGPAQEVEAHLRATHPRSSLAYGALLEALRDLAEPEGTPSAGLR
ncbi:MarR family winged helix-turn-helix transcriptional regulator [Streptomyces sp. NPDC096105]|uniref:MarR family winged helix-turn-helix transcriptional regulator n=1 Tax=Streptomyces sp. NPDC096105 TaxID=3366074 RepID=UPI0038134E5E